MFQFFLQILEESDEDSCENAAHGECLLAAACRNDNNRGYSTGAHGSRRSRCSTRLLWNGWGTCSLRELGNTACGPWLRLGAAVRRSGELVSVFGGRSHLRLCLTGLGDDNFHSIGLVGRRYGSLVDLGVGGARGSLGFSDDR